MSECLQGWGGKQEDKEEGEQEKPSFSANFPLCTERDSYGVGYTCEPAQGSCTGKLQAVNDLQSMAGL